MAFFGQPLFCAASPTLPAGGQVVSGAATFSQSGTTLTVTQTSPRAATNWQSFNIGVGKTVNFVQPSASAVSLNRVVGNDVSVIQGALNANGHVFLLNPNGVLFTPTAQVNVGGIVASTLRMNTEDFMAGRYQRDKWELNSAVASRAWGGAPEADTRVKGGGPAFGWG